MAAFNGIILTDSLTIGSGIRPLGAYAIAKELRNYGYKILVINFISQIEIEHLENIIKRLITSDTIFLGYSSSLFLDIKTNNVFIWTLDKFKEFNTNIKQFYPEIKIIFGGAYSKKLVNYSYKHNDSFGIDYVFHGYSEKMILDFVENSQKNIRQKISLSTSKIKEIDYDSQGKEFNFQVSEHRWDNDDFISQGEVLPLEVARGCIFKCKFCSYPLLGKSIKDDSYIRLEKNIKNEIYDNFSRFGTTHYFVIDDTFNERTDKIELLLRIRDSLKLDLTFTGYNRLDLIARKPNQIKLLRDLNFSGTIFGIESMNHASTKSIGKGISPEEVKETLYKFKDEFPESSILGSFIIGLPYENEETLESWTPWILSDKCPLDSVSFNALHMSSSTHNQSEFDKNPEKYGYIKKENNDWSNQYWNREKCQYLSDLLSKLSDRKKIPVPVVMSLLKLGYDYKKMIKVSMREFSHPKFQVDMQIRIEKYVEKYFEKIKNLEH